MPLAWVEGFEDDSILEPHHATNVVIHPTGRTGKCLRILGNSDFAVMDLSKIGAASDIITVGFAMYLTGTGVGNYPIIIWSGDTSSISSSYGMNVELPGSGALRVKNTSTTLATSAIGVMPAATWVYVEIQMKLHDTAGIFILKINGVTIFNLSNVDTRRSSDIGYGAMAWTPSTSSVSPVMIDDVYFAAGTLADPFYGDSRVDTLVPNGNGSVNAWVGSDGNNTDNYLLVDEIPPSASDFVSSATPGAQDLYTLPDVGPGTIHAISPTVYAAKDETGTRTIRPVLKRNTTHVGNAQSLNYGFGYRMWHYNADPDGSYGAEQNPTIGGAPATVSQPTAGTRWRFLRGGRITKLRYQRRAADFSPLTLKVWNTLGVKLAEIADAQSTGGYFTVTLPTPVTVVYGDVLTCSYSHASTVPATASAFAVTNTADCEFLGYYYTITAGDVYPATIAPTTSFFVEPIFEPLGGWNASAVNALEVGVEVA